MTFLALFVFQLWSLFLDFWHPSSWFWGEKVYNLLLTTFDEKKITDQLNSSFQVLLYKPSTVRPNRNFAMKWKIFVSALVQVCRWGELFNTENQIFCKEFNLLLFNNILVYGNFAKINCTKIKLGFYYFYPCPLFYLDLKKTYRFQIKNKFTSVREHIFSKLNFMTHIMWGWPIIDHLFFSLI